MTDKERNNGFELYKAFSEADSRFVDEMLDDDLAEKIRAANKRRRIRLYSTFAAAAAVVVIAVGLSVFPRESIGKSETAKENIAFGENSRGNMGAGENADGDALYAPEAEKAEDAPMNIAPPTTTAAETDNAPKTQEMFDGEEQPAEEKAAELPSSAAESSSSKDGFDYTGKSSHKGAAVSPVPSDDVPYEETPPDDIDLPDLSSVDDSSESGGAKDSAPEVDAETVALSDNVVFALAEEVSNNHRGRLLAEGDGFTLYSFDNCDPEAIVTVERDGVYRAALRVGALPDTLEELAEALDLKRYLRCEGIEGSETRLTDEQFRDEVLSDLLADGDKLTLTDSKPAGEGITCLCRLGTDRETYADGIMLTVFEDGSVYFTALGMSGSYTHEE